MKQTIAPGMTPSPLLVRGNSNVKAASSKVAKDSAEASSPTSVFVGMALDMSWRLAAAVLVPIIGGHYLDQLLKTSPLMLIVGFVLAMGGMAIVLWQTLQVANAKPVAKNSTQTKGGKQ